MFRCAPEETRIRGFAAPQERQDARNFPLAVTFRFVRRRPPAVNLSCKADSQHFIPVSPEDRYHMSEPITLDALDLAALLCSRVCHDLISPAGAIVNGLEVWEKSTDDETRAFALDLIKKSARTASARLQFCRIAFGAAGSAGAELDLGEAEKVARMFIEDEKVKVAWNLPRALLPKNRVKLLLNMVLVAAQTIPRGGILVVEGDGARTGDDLQDHIARSQCPHPPGDAAPARRYSRKRPCGRPRHSAILYGRAGPDLRTCRGDGARGRCYPGHCPAGIEGCWSCGSMKSR